MDTLSKQKMGRYARWTKSNGKTFMDVLGLVTAFASSQNSILESFSANGSIGTTSGEVNVVNFTSDHGAAIICVCDNESGIVDVNNPIFIGSSRTTLFEINANTNDRAQFDVWISNNTTLSIRLLKSFTSGHNSSCSYKFFGFAF